MSNSKTSTSSATISGGSSLLQKMIPASVAQAVVLPYVSNLTSGKYTSEIVDVVDAIQNGIVVGIDCTHKLTDADGNTLLVKFRFFDPFDTEALLQVLSTYGLSGNIGNALKGLQEIVDVAPRPKSNRYMYIAHRVLSTVPLSPTSDSTNNSAISKKGGLSSRLGSRGNKPMQTSRRPLISVDEEDIDDEFDDFLDDSED